MSEFWTVADETRVKSGYGLLAESTKVVKRCIDMGPCPLSEEEIQEAIHMANAAAAILGKVGTS